MSKNDEKIPTTAMEAFAQLDALLNDEDKRELVESVDAVALAHFGLGSWIRNNWVYPLNGDERESLLKLFVDESESPYGFFIFHPDDVSTTIINKYVEYLKNKS